MDFDIEEMKAAGKDATPGKWVFHASYEVRSVSGVSGTSIIKTLSGASHYGEEYWAVVSDGEREDKEGEQGSGVICDNGQYYATDVSKEDARWIAAASPTAVAALIAEYERVCAELAVIKGEGA